MALTTTTKSEATALDLGRARDLLRGRLADRTHNVADEAPTPFLGTWQQELATALLTGGIGYLAACYAFSRWLTRPRLRSPRKRPDSLRLPWKALQIKTDDGVPLAGWIVEPKTPRGTVALFHGMAKNREHMLGRIGMFTAAGYRCVAFDHRAHGESGGNVNSFGFFEARDVRAVLGYIRRFWPDQPVSALGVSMGAAALCYAADAVRSCQAVILESCYYDIARTFNHRLGREYPAWLKRFIRGIIWISERRPRCSPPPARSRKLCRQTRTRLRAVLDWQ
ncbi:MAG: hypothetical protein KatS3mg105_2931 [Gemmatales bacterium]|nr:MAG: hypothetical protein KatS3mg105_2931 [Gemmatales bacterium]